MSPESTDVAPGFEALARALDAARAGSTAPEVHGMLCAQLCSPRPFDAEGWLGDVFGAEPGTPAALERCSGLLAALARETSAELAGGEFALRLLLPGDEQPLAERAAALGEWCEGFLYGLGLAGPVNPRDFGREGAEFLADLGAICRVDARGAEGELDEAAFAELVEYVRAGAALVREALHEAAAGGGSD